MWSIHQGQHIPIQEQSVCLEASIKVLRLLLRFSVFDYGLRQDKTVYNGI